MKLTGRRESTNVDDRRGMTAAKAGGVGIVGIIIALVMTFMSKGSLNLADIISLAPSMMGNVTEQAEGGREFTEEEQQLATFSKQILAGTEDVWTEEFKKLGRTYEPPKMVLYTGAVQTGCGNGSASMGPFYCSADQCLYIDLSFFTLRHCSRSGTPRGIPAWHAWQSASADVETQPDRGQQAERPPRTPCRFLCRRLGLSRQQDVRQPGRWRPRGSYPLRSSHRRQLPSGEGSRLFSARDLYSWHFEAAHEVAEAWPADRRHPSGHNLPVQRCRTLKKNRERGL